MKLQKRVNRRVGNKEYLKYYVDIPSEKIKESGWKEGEELEFQFNGSKLTLKPKNNSSKKVSMD